MSYGTRPWIESSREGYALISAPIVDRALQETSVQKQHISVCICTYQRPDLLARLCEELRKQATDDLFTFSIIVVDNDQAQSAKAVATAFAASSSINIRYCVEPQQNIALARNKAVENADGDFVAFIDDDEFPTRQWLLTLFKTCREYDVDGVLGPVKPHFRDDVPRWVVKGGFYDRPSYRTGLVIDGKKGRTGNVLLKKKIFTAGEQPFRPEFRTGEDQDFFRRMIDKGHVFIWCDEAMAYEDVPPVRWKRTFMLKRALLRGATTVIHPTFGAKDIAKSIVAVPLYAMALPFALLGGQHLFMLLSVKLCDHLGKLLALAGVQPVKQQYVTN
jgi:succinoglycan biosynthesis protein ExoM